MPETFEANAKYDIKEFLFAIGVGIAAGIMVVVIDRYLLTPISNNLPAGIRPPARGV